MLLLAIVSLQVPLVSSLRSRVNAEVRSEAMSEADVVAASATGGAGSHLGELASAAASAVRGRIIVTDARGLVLVDSAGRSDVGVSYAGRPEVAAALRGRRVQRERYAASLDQHLLATAVPVVRAGRTVGAVRVTQSVAAVHRALARITLELILLGAVVLGLGLVAALVVARRVARPIGRLDDAARRVAAGDLDARAREDDGSLEQRSLARSFNAMTERLARLLRAQKDFVADASHQLRTPLTGVRLRIEEAQAVGVSPAASAQLTAGAAEVDRMALIIDELLVLSRVGERELPPDRVDLAAVAARAAERWAPIAGEAGLHVALAETDGGAPVACAAADLDRAVDVLLENAVRYGGDPIELAVGRGWLEVRDRGPGLAPGEEDAVWERFHRGGAGRRGPGGTGLGLPIARELAAEWGGPATLRNRDGGGAVARLELPLA